MAFLDSLTLPILSIHMHNIFFYYIIQEGRLAEEIITLEKETGFKLRVLAQNYPNTPGSSLYSKALLEWEHKLILG